MGTHADVSLGSLTTASEEPPRCGTGGGFVSVLPGIRLRQWGSETACVVFVPQSNSTHLITREAGLVLQAAQGGQVEVATVDSAIVSGLLTAGFLQSSDPT